MKYFNETYRRREFLSRNEWADTYRSTHAVTDDHVTLKILVRQSNDEEYINNLLKEIETIKTIKNPNLIHINNMFKYSGFGKTYYYIEAEYFKGDSLKEVIENSKIDKKEAVKIVERVAEGIKEFHDKNILFNFLNIENILMNSREIIKIDVLSYLEHKNFKVKENEFNPQKDIHALGEVLYCLLTGNLIFDKDKYKKDIKDDILIKIIDRATNPECESRYININRMIIDLKLYLQIGDIKSDNYTYDENLHKNKKKKKQKNKKEKNEKKSKQDKKEVKETQGKKEYKEKKGKLGKVFIVCIVVALLLGAAVYGYEDLLKVNNTNVSDESSKNELSNQIKDQDKNKGVQLKKEESQEEQFNSKEENKTTSSSKMESNKKSEITSSLNNPKKNNNTSISSNNNSSNTNLNNNSSNNDNSSNSNDNQRSENTTNPNEGNNDNGNNNTNQAIETTPDVDNRSNGMESIQKNELDIQ